MDLKAPFPWFGGKSRVADLVWAYFGNPINYVEPFAGSLAVALGRPTEPRSETINDQECYLVNFWRSVANDPEGVARVADYPISEIDLIARHRELVGKRELVEKCRSDARFYDVEIAGWWVWGISQWIGSGWCQKPEWNRSVGARRGIHTQKRPSLKRGGVGVHSTMRDPRGRETVSGGQGEVVLEMMMGLQARLRRVRMLCGDWKRAVTPALTTAVGVTGVFLDPPYLCDGSRKEGIYNEDSADVARECEAWCRENEDDPKLRIALCGYDGQYALSDRWTTVRWTANGGYANRSGGANGNKHREVVLFSPSCEVPSMTLFDGRDMTYDSKGTLFPAT